MRFFDKAFSYPERYCDGDDDIISSGFSCRRILSRFQKKGNGPFRDVSCGRVSSFFGRGSVTVEAAVVMPLVLMTVTASVWLTVRAWRLAVTGSRCICVAYEGGSGEAEGYAGISVIITEDGGKRTARFIEEDGGLFSGAGTEKEFVAKKITDSATDEVRDRICLLK